MPTSTAPILTSLHPQPVDPRKALGLRVKQLRATKGLTQEDLADRCQMFRTYLSRIESGQANPTLTMLYDLALGLEVSVQELLAIPSDLESAPKKVRASTPISRGRVRA